MAYTEVTHESWLGRLKSAMVGIGIGGVMFVVAFPVLWWNEGNTLRTYQMLQEVLGKVVVVASDEVDASNEDKLVHVTGPTHTEDQVRDPQFGIAENALRLRRTAEIYQWDEHSHSTKKKKLGGGTKTVTEYTYKAVWSASPIDSSNFKDPEYRGRNKTEMPYRSKTFDAHAVHLGAFALNRDLIASLNNFESYSADPGTLPAALQGKAKPHQGGYYFGQSPAAPANGDLRVRFSIVRPAEASVIARQRGNSFEPFPSETGKSFEMLKVGVHSPEAMVAEKQRANTIRKWLLRAAGFILMFLGLVFVVRPLSVLADVIPLIGSLVGMGTALVAGVVALVLSSLTIGIAWVFYRPWVGVPLIVFSVALLAWLLTRQRKSLRAH